MHATTATTALACAGRHNEKPAPEVLAGLKAHGFRWARRSRRWHGRDRAYAEDLAK